MLIRDTKALQKIIPALCCGLLLFCAGGCGKADGLEEGAASGEAEEGVVSDEGENSEPKETIYTEPPEMALYAASDNTDGITLMPSGYNWTYLKTAEQATNLLADCADPLAENAPWEVLTISDNISGNTSNDISSSTSGAVEYIVSVPLPKYPGTCRVQAWDAADIGKYSMECQALEDYFYDREEMASGSFPISLQAGRIYSVYIGWDKADMEENGFYGDVSYTFKTSGKAEDGGLTGLDNAESGHREWESVEPMESDDMEPGLPAAEIGDKCSDELAIMDGVIMAASDITRKDGTFVITNHTGKELIYGDDYSLQAWQDGEWYDIKYIIDNWAFNAIGYPLGKEAEKEYYVDWSFFHGILPDGHYRILKTVSYEQEKGTPVSYIMAAEFDVGTF